VPDTAERGETIEIVVGAENAGRSYEVWMFSSPRHLATATVNAAGELLATIPSDAALGEHRIAVAQTDGTLLGWDDLRVVDTAAAGGPGAGGDGLASTGVAVGGAAALALLLLLAGTLVVIRRRRTA